VRLWFLLFFSKLSLLLGLFTSISLLFLNSSFQDDHPHSISSFLPDHHAPRIAKLLDIVHAMDKYLEEDERNVAVVHCNAGKGRTGTIIACYLLLKGIYSTPDEALAFFAQKRTSNFSGVRVPSQLRYCNYFFAILKAVRAASAPSLSSPLRLSPPASLPFLLESISFSQVPLWDKLETLGNGFNVRVKVMQVTDRLPHKILCLSSRVHKARAAGSSELFAVVDLACIVAGMNDSSLYFTSPQSTSSLRPPPHSHILPLPPLSQVTS
jgi:hypothetical protein